eukprot:5555751-Pleurochrysis_carterae.AAC.2
MSAEPARMSELAEVTDQHGLRSRNCCPTLPALTCPFSSMPVVRCVCAPCDAPLGPVKPQWPWLPQYALLTATTIVAEMPTRRRCILPAKYGLCNEVSISPFVSESLTF